MVRGDYDEAEDRFMESLKVNRAIGNQAGEAATLSQLGIMAARAGRLREGLRLVIVSYVLSQQIGHAQAQQTWQNATAMASDLGYDQAQYDTEKEAALASYAEDRGDALLREAFPEGWAEGLPDGGASEGAPGDE
jgi:tetratricopeptide (TPR) repeat protein